MAAICDSHVESNLIGLLRTLVWIALILPSGTYVLGNQFEDHILSSAGGVGSSSSSATSEELSIGLRFDVEPSDAVVTRGSDVTFECSASEAIASSGGGSGQHSSGRSLLSVAVTWRKDGETIPGTSRRSSGGSRRTVLADGRLRIERVQNRADVGFYECVASSRHGIIVSRRASLEIADLGRFTVQPQEVSESEGGTARFQCGREGTPKPVITWEKNNEPLPESERFVVLSSAGVLLIEDVRLADAGTYRCRAVNIGRERHSNNATLHVTAADTAIDDADPDLIIGPEDTEVVVGETAILECSAAGSSRLIWRRLDERPIPANRSRVLGRGCLEIHNVTTDDEGMYRCSLEDFPHKSAEAMISVAGKKLYTSYMT